MAVLKNETKNIILISDLEVATGFVRRGLGLIPRREMRDQEGILIPACKSIHTFFMSFPIDCVFVDRSFKVTNLVENIKPWRMTKFFWKADAVIELTGGSIQRHRIDVGDQLHVGG